MKPLIKIVGTVAGISFLSFWIVYALLLAVWPHTGLSQFLGFVPTPPLSPATALLMWAFVILGAPASFLLDGTSGDHFMLLMVPSSILNCVIWGVCVGFPIYAVRKRFRQVALS